MLVYAQATLTSVVPIQGRQRGPGACQCSGLTGIDVGLQGTHFRRGLIASRTLGNCTQGWETLYSRKSMECARRCSLDKQIAGYEIAGGKRPWRGLLACSWGLHTALGPVNRGIRSRIWLCN